MRRQPAPEKKLRREHFVSLCAGLVFSLVLSLAGFFLCSPLLSFLKTPAELMDPAAGYLRIVLLSLPAALLYNLYSALFRAVGRPRAPMLILAFSTGAKLLLDLLFVAVLHMGAAGAGLATALSQILSALLSLLFLFLKAPFLVPAKEDCRMDLTLLKKTLRLSFVTGFHQCALYLGKMMVQGAVNTGGTPLITAFTASMRIEGFANSFGDSGSAATSVLTAQNFGAGRNDRVRDCFKVSLRLLSVLGIGMGLVMTAFASPLTVLITGSSDPLMLGEVVSYLRIVSLFYVFCFTGNTFAGYFDGRGRVLIPFLGAAGHITLRVILSWLLISHFQLSAVAFSTGIGWVLVNLFWTLVLLRSSR